MTEYRKMSLLVGLAFMATSGVAQVTQPCIQAIEKQQVKIVREVYVLLTNFETSWNITFPNGASKRRDGHLECIAAWNPKLNAR
jgi:hypothetical protein